MPRPDEHHERRERHEEPAPWTDDRLDRWLAEANTRVQVPVDLLDRVQDRIETLDRTTRRRWWRSGLSAAAIVLLSVVGALVLERSRPNDQSIADGTVETAPSPRDATDHRRHVQVRFDADSTMFSRRVDTRSPNVTIHLLYRGIEPALAEAGNVDPPPRGNET